MLWIATACNHEVFLDKEDIPEDFNATIEGDGGEMVITIPIARLLHIGMASLSVSQQHVNFFDTAGEVIDQNAPVENVGKIVYRTERIHLELIKRGDVLKIRSGYNYTGVAFVCPIWMEYEFGVWHVVITILPSRQV